MVGTREHKLKMVRIYIKKVTHIYVECCGGTMNFLLCTLLKYGT